MPTAPEVRAPCARPAHRAEFKRQAPEAQLEGIRPLLKAYQHEVDALTTRAKQAEGVLLELHERLGGAPDPYPVFEALVDHTVLSQDVERVRQERDAARAEAAAAAAAAEQERAAAAELRARDADAERRTAEAVAGATERASEKHAELRRELTAAQTHVRQLRASHEQLTAQLLTQGGANASAADSAQANMAQLERLMAELQRANERAAQAERRREQLHTELAAEEREAQARHDAELARLRAQLREQQQHVLRLREVLEREHEAQQVRASAERDSLVQQVQRTQAEAGALRAALEAHSDYEEIKRELAVLKAVEFAGEADDEEPAAGASQLEAHLVQRNKKLQDELATLRATLSERAREADAAAQELAAAQARTAELQALNGKLEQDLLGAGGARGADAAEPRAANAGLLEIVTGQRDRFRTRNAELEEELRAQLESITELRGEVRRLQADNLGMYEKMRYLQAYGARSSGGAPSDMPYPPDTSAGIAPGDEEEGYRKRYEQSLHPFERFRGREQLRAVAALSPVDRLLHMLASAVLGSAHMRLVFVGYALLLHLLVFFMLFDAGHRYVEETQGGR